MSPVRTAVGADDRHEAGARRALLQRLAGDMAVMANTWQMEWTCCWLSYAGPGGVTWAWRMCGGGMPGHPGSKPCGHWHHQFEAFTVYAQLPVD